jgi:hypothetical protein
MRIVLLALMVLLAGCTNPSAERAAAAGQFIGRTEADLVAAAGVPARTVEAGGRRFVVYEERRVDMVGPYGRFGYPGPYGWGRPYYGGGFPSQAVEYVCETNFEIVDGKVAGFALHGNAC